MLKLALLALTLVSLVSVANATKPSAASGGFNATATVTSMRTAGPNTIIESKITFTATGTFAGTCVGTEHAVMLPDGHGTTHGECTFTTSTGENPKTGTAVFRFQAIGQGTSFHGRFVVGDGTGTLAGLHAVGTFQGTATGATTSAGTYSGTMHVDPS